VHARFAKYNMTLRNPAKLYRTLTSLANQGVDTALNKTWIDGYRREVIEHIRWLNTQSVVSRPNPASILSSSTVTAIKSEIDQLFTRDPSAYIASERPHLRTALAEFTSRILGIASVSPGIIRDMVDTETGDRLSLRQVIARMSVDQADTGNWLASYPADLVTLCLDHGYELPAPRTGVIPDEFLPLVDSAISIATLRQPAPWPGTNAKRAYYDMLLADTLDLVEVYLHNTYQNALAF
jgi:hypothetical protein